MRTAFFADRLWLTVWRRKYNPKALAIFDSMFCVIFFDKSASNDISAMNLRGVVDYLQAKGLMNISGLDSLIGRASDLFESKLGM